MIRQWLSEVAELKEEKEISADMAETMQHAPRPKFEHTELPPRGYAGRWTMARKGGVADAVQRGLLTPDAAVARYPGLTLDELQSWMSAYKAVGRRGLAAHKGLAEMRPGTRFRTTRERANARDLIPASAHQGVSRIGPLSSDVVLRRAQAVEVELAHQGDHPGKEGVLAGEVCVERALGGLGSLGDDVHRGALEAALEEHVLCGHEDVLAELLASSRRHGGPFLK